jgi:hypothetical protein
VVAVITDQPDLSLEETAAELLRHRIRTSRSALSRFFHRHDFTSDKPGAGGTLVSLSSRHEGEVFGMTFEDRQQEYSQRLLAIDSEFANLDAQYLALAAEWNSTDSIDEGGRAHRTAIVGVAQREGDGHRRQSHVTKLMLDAKQQQAEEDRRAKQAECKQLADGVCTANGSIDAIFKQLVEACETARLVAASVALPQCQPRRAHQVTEVRLDPKRLLAWSRKIRRARTLRPEQSMLADLHQRGAAGP